MMKAQNKTQRSDGIERLNNPVTAIRSRLSRRSELSLFPSITDLEFHLFNAEVVGRLQDEDFEHQDNVERFSADIGGAFFVVDLIEGGAKDFLWEDLFEFGQDVIECVDFVESFFEIEEGRGMMFHRKDKKMQKKKSG